MIVFDLCCDNSHRFEGWFGSSSDFAAQQEAGLVQCPECGSPAVAKAPMAPAVARKGNQRSVTRAQQQSDETVPADAAVARPLANQPMPPEVVKAMAKLAEAQAKALKDSKWVGRDFAEASRAMHYGERDAEAIHGEASLADAKEMLEEGIAIAPLPFPVVRPDEVN